MMCSGCRDEVPGMKSFADTSFFLLFDEIVRRDKPENGASTWSAAGVTWRHSRHSYEGQGYGFATEVFLAVCPLEGGWSLVVAKEHWWAGRHGGVIRSAHWAKPLSGPRSAIVAWFRTRRREMEAGH